MRADEEKWTERLPLYPGCGRRFGVSSSCGGKIALQHGLLLLELVLTGSFFSTLILLLFLFFSFQRLMYIVEDLPYFLVLASSYCRCSMPITIRSARSMSGLRFSSSISPRSGFLFTLFFFNKETFSRGKILSLFSLFWGAIVWGIPNRFIKIEQDWHRERLDRFSFFTFYMLLGEKGWRNTIHGHFILYGLDPCGSLFDFHFTDEVIAGGLFIQDLDAFFYIAIFLNLDSLWTLFSRELSDPFNPGKHYGTWEPAVAGLTAYFVLGKCCILFQIAGRFRSHDRQLVSASRFQKRKVPPPLQ